jgi:SAM-dependent methyltransferase
MRTAHIEGDRDPYATPVHRWWHLSEASPELLATLDSGWLTTPGRVLDLGCGLGTELGFLARVGFLAVGIDLSGIALASAQSAFPVANFVVADLRDLPFSDGAFDAILDRGTFHYMPPDDRPRYEREARRVLQPGGRLLLRACLTTAGVRNDLDFGVVRQTFSGWRIVSLEKSEILSNTRHMPALVARLERI